MVCVDLVEEAGSDRSLRLVAAGYFGEGNLGDDALLAGFRVAAGELGATVIPLLGPHALDDHAVPRRDFKAIAAAVRDADALVFPGGSIFQDVTSWRSPLYYANVVRVAANQDKPVVMIGQGVGPLRSWIGRRVARTAFNQCRLVGVRDPGSLETLSGLGVRCRTELGADSALLLPPANSDARSGVGLSMRAFGAHDEDLIAPARALIAALRAAGESVVCLPMDAADRAFAERLMEGEAGVRMEVCPTPEAFIELASGLRGMVAMRLHAGILGALGGCPPIMLSYDPKVTAFADLIQRPWFDATAYNPDDVARRIMNPDGTHWRDKFEALRLAARRNIELLREGLA